jgi:hypothetical protein
MQPDTNYDTTDRFLNSELQVLITVSHSDQRTWSKSDTHKTSVTIPEKGNLGDLDAMIIHKWLLQEQDMKVQTGFS